VVGFALFLGLIIVLGRAMGKTFGATGAVAGAIFVGIADIDARSEPAALHSPIAGPSAQASRCFSSALVRPVLHISSAPSLAA